VFNIGAFLGPDGDRFISLFIKRNVPLSAARDTKKMFVPVDRIYFEVNYLAKE
jgi:hypothetical protein